MSCPIGVFDSGYGGLTILKDIVKEMPEYDYIYLGDNARTPYGTRSFDVVYKYTREAVLKLFGMGCKLVILACNTASAKALRTIQQVDLPRIDPQRRVLGVIRPSVEAVADFTGNGHIGILATSGTVASESYLLEIAKIHSEKGFLVTQQACPMWVPIVENNEMNSPGAAFFVQKYIDTILQADPQIDTLVLACTHYPLLIEKIRRYVPTGVTLLPQGEYVASSLEDYLHRHPEMDCKLTKGGTCCFLTTESAEKFSEAASVFLSRPIKVEQVVID